MRFKITLIGVAVLAILAVGCGGGGGDTTAGGSSGNGTTDSGATTNASTDGNESAGSGPLSKAEFVKQGDAICEKIPPGYQSGLKALEEENETQGKPKPSKAEENLKAAVPPLYTAIEELEALEPPSGEEQQAEAIVTALEAAAKGVEEKPTSELAGPKSPFAEFQKLSGEYGLELCSQL